MSSNIVMIEISHDSLLFEVEVNLLHFAVIVLPAKEEVVEKVDFLADRVVGLRVGGNFQNRALGLHIVNRELDTLGVAVDFVLQFYFLSKVFPSVEEALAGFVYGQDEVDALGTLQGQYY